MKQNIIVTFLQKLTHLFSHKDTHRLNGWNLRKKSQIHHSGEYGDSPIYRCIPFTGAILFAIHKIAVFYMFYDFPLPFLQLMCTMCCFNWK